MAKLPEAKPAPAFPEGKHFHPGSGLGLTNPFNLAIAIVAVVGFFVFFNTPKERMPSGGLLAAAITVFVLLLLAAAVGVFIYRAKAFNARSAELTKLVLDRQFDQAERALDSTAKAFEDLAPAKASCAYLLGSIALQRGRFERAASFAYAASRNADADSVRPVAGWSPALLCSAAALGGDLRMAQAWLPVAKMGADLLGLPSDLLPRVIVLARQNQPAEVLSAIAAAGPALAAMPGDVTRPVKLFEAFAKAALGQDAQAALAVAKSGPADELDHYGDAWPELSALVRGS